PASLAIVAPALVPLIDLDCGDVVAAAGGAFHGSSLGLAGLDAIGCVRHRQSGWPLRANTHNALAAVGGFIGPISCGRESSLRPGRRCGKRCWALCVCTVLAYRAHFGSSTP